MEKAFLLLQNNNMKKQLLFLVTIFFATKAFNQSQAPGQLKITLVSAKCINKSWDGIIEFDGHGNEISVVNSYRIYSAVNTANIKSGNFSSAIFGSNVNGMTRAGSQTPNFGGINNGDVIQVGKVLIDVHLNADDYILLAPSLWEWDNIAEKNTLNNFNSQVDGDLNWAMTQPFPFSTTSIGYTNPYNERVIKNFDKYRYGPALKYQNIFNNVVCPGNGQGNRVIGLRTGTFNNVCTIVYPPTLLCLDTRLLMSVVNHNKSVQANAGSTHPERPSYISGVVEIVFTENTDHNITTSNGQYSIKLNIEFIPDVVSAPVSNTPPPLTGSINNNTVFIKKSNGVLNLNVVGNWSGKQVNSDGNYPQAVSFQLTNTGEIIFATAEKGEIGAKGTYTFSKGNINGSYTILSSNEVISFTGTLDPNTQKLNCTLGFGTSTTNQGKWTMVRN